VKKFQNFKMLIRDRLWQADPLDTSSDEDDDEDIALQLEQVEEKTLRISLRINETNDASGDSSACCVFYRPVIYRPSGDSSACCVMYNQDEDRFTQESTLNLKTFSLYRISLELEIDEKLEYVALGRKTYYNMLVEENLDKEYFDIVEKPSSGKKVYSFVYSTDKVRATDRHHRTVLPCSLKLLKYGKLEFKLLVNFCYSNKTDHLVGLPLSVIDLQATFGADTVLEGISYE